MIDYNNANTLKCLTGFGKKSPRYVYPSEWNSEIKTMFHNDVEFLRLLLDSPTGDRVSTLSINFSEELDPRLRSYVSNLMREFPLLRGCSSPEEAFEFIRSRNLQYGSEIEDYRQRLVDILDDSISKSSVSSSPVDNNNK